MNDKDFKEIDGVVLSLKPKYWQAICEGRKNLEVRKSMPSEFNALVARDGFMRCYVVISGSGGLVKGFFNCKQIIYSHRASDILRAGETCLTPKEIHEYGKGRNGLLYGWRIEDAGQYKDPLPLSVFGMERAPQSWAYCYL